MTTTDVPTGTREYTNQYDSKTQSPSCAPLAESVDAAQLSFHLQEAEALRAEIAVAMREMSVLERAALVATGAVWAWLATRPWVASAAWLIPILFPLFGAFRCVTLGRSIGLVGAYLHAVEHAVLAPHAGWEHYLRQQTPAGIFRSAIWYWSALFVITALVAAVKYRTS